MFMGAFTSRASSQEPFWGAVRRPTVSRITPPAPVSVHCRTQWCGRAPGGAAGAGKRTGFPTKQPTVAIMSGHGSARSEEHTSELQSRVDLVCRLLLEKKKKNKDEERAT